MEYRNGFDFRWLQAAALVWGLGLAENWMMLLTLPLFVVAVFWLGKFRVLSTKIISQLALAGLAGFVVFALLPMVNGLSPHSPWTLGEAWLETLRNFKRIIAVVYYNFWRAHRLAFIAVVIFYLVPILTSVVRLRDEGTQNKSGVDRLQVWIYRALLVGVLLACCWLAFNPAVGPQQIVLKQVGLALPFLSLSYLLAICAGFLTGNLLLAFSRPPANNYRRPNAAEKFLRHATIPAFGALLAIVAAGLIFRNAPAVTLVNRQSLEEYGRLAANNLPTGKGIVLSDGPERLVIYQAAAAKAGQYWLALNTQLLSVPAYRRWALAKNPGDWPAFSKTNNLTPIESLQWLTQLVASNQVYYLHPSFGLYFEGIYLKPKGSVYGLKNFTDKSVNPPPMTDGEIGRTEKFWSDFTPQLDAISHSVSPSKPGRNAFTKLIYNRLHLQPPPAIQSQLLGEWYSLALNDWGVQLQQAGKIEAAQVRFTQAIALNPNNTAAKVNQQCNSNLMAKVKMNLSAVEGISSQLGTLPHMSRFLEIFGMVDEPSFCYVLGGTFLKASMPRQALQQFERAHALAPDVIAPKLALAELYQRLGFAEKSRSFIAEARTDLSAQPQKNEIETGLALMEAGSWLTQSNTANARDILQNLLQTDPNNPRTQNQVLRAYLSFGDYTNAAAIVNRQLADDPDNLTALANRAVIQIKQGALTNAVTTLNHILTLTNATDVRILRNSTLIQLGQLDAAEKDYLELRQTLENTTPVDYDLSEIAVRRRDTNHAIALLEGCLTNVPAGSPQYQMLTNRINLLKRP
jgi:tetratricopeptide (TPR) repeat protein